MLTKLLDAMERFDAWTSDVESSALRRYWY